ncbi:protein of unknown function [Candidatus Filomicrobium marinum]|uniref:Uncharacterized protein n=1 Tax=Candidatus Filomicrobium marinum TaxID=1608628 RepID=A0A0D6JJY3_9HYPH|nr:hypothetical protein [Candidatus Filomicrobium marinum]CFX57774.1 protein of unknown function [Candidatus Filomicrobium marinum]CPR22299.1 protein of unknown function [Candidatus Filomicrobium marinum]
MNLSCWRLTEFNLSGQIELQGKHGLVRIRRSDDGAVVLVESDELTASTLGESKPATFAVSDAILGFVLDIGIAREKALTRYDGYYWGEAVRPVQSSRAISQSDFDADTFAWIVDTINLAFQSKSKSEAIKAIRCQHLMDTYNNGRLMYPNYCSETYVSMLRIIEAAGADNSSPRSRGRTRLEFAMKAAQISGQINQEVVSAIDAMPVFKPRTDKARAKFAAVLAKQDGDVAAALSSFDDSTQVAFVCFLSAYVYRNKFMHIGFPIPDSVKEAFGYVGPGALYLPLSTGLAWRRTFNHGALFENDFIELHEMIEPKDLSDFRDTFAYVLPTWYFLRTFAREAILQQLEILSGSPRP